MTTSSDGTSEPTVGVLSLHRSKETKAILNAVDDLGYGTEWLRAENLAVEIESGEPRLEPVVDVVVGIGGTQHTVSASIEDRSHMDYSLLLGRDILEHYRVDVRRRVDEDREPNTEEELSEE